MKAKDFLKKLESEPEYQEMRRCNNLELEKRATLLAKDERCLVEELRSIGFEISSVWDFVNNNCRYEFLRKFGGSYNGAYSILVRHLNEKHHPRIREGIVRALTEKDANKVASETLLAAFYEEQDANMKWVLANALRTVLTRSQKAKHPEYKGVLSNKGST